MWSAARPGPTSRTAGRPGASAADRVVEAFELSGGVGLDGIGVAHPPERVGVDDGDVDVHRSSGRQRHRFSSVS